MLTVDSWTVWKWNQRIVFRPKHSLCALPHSRGISSHKAWCHFYRIEKYLKSPVKHRNTDWRTDTHTHPQLLHTLRVPLNPFITPSQSPEIHIKIPNPAGASRSLGMAAPWITPCMDARQRPPALPRKAPLPTWRVLHSHGHYFSLTRLS